MSDNPDIARIVSLIMENPSLIEQISALARADGESPVETPPAEPPTETPVAAAPLSAEPPAQEPRNMHRKKLLMAMKPYLSEERCRAIDSMISISEVLDMMRRR